MKNKILHLNALLKFSAFIPIKLAWLCLFNQKGGIEFFNLSALTPDLEKLFIVLGGFISAILVIQILCIIWIYQRKIEAYTLSLFIGSITIGRGLMMLVFFHIHHISEIIIILTPILIGMLILVLTLIARKDFLSLK
ncbi:MAG: hypothetical protein ABI851_06015 [Saprospiraceae bacterium]